MTHPVTIHGHFYQPPREDPFTGEMPREAGAEPYHDYNEKITAECYQPNADAGNFDRISFNIGPTLIQWLAHYQPRTYERILQADRIYQQTHGAGNAIAQPAHHTILPLARRRDKITQIAWGIGSFRRRFQRQPRGMWLPEMAVDLPTLQILSRTRPVVYDLERRAGARRFAGRRRAVSGAAAGGRLFCRVRARSVSVESTLV